MYRASLAMFHARLGNAGEAREQLRQFTDSDFSILTRSNRWAAGMVMLADAATWLGDAEAAASILELLAPVAGRTAWPVIALWPIDLALAQLCVVLGDHPGARSPPRRGRGSL